MSKNQSVSLSVIKRLPRYYRFLGELMAEGVTRISSRELAQMLNLTASQIRQDLNCFGGFGQQGYGYNVQSLRRQIGCILGLEEEFPIIQIGVGNLGRAIVNHVDYETMGFRLLGLFDSSSTLVGTTLGEMEVHSTEELTEFCTREKPTAAVLCVPKESAVELVPLLQSLGLRAFWNFSNYDIPSLRGKAVVENVHLSDSLMTLCYQVKELSEQSGQGEQPAEPESAPEDEAW